MSDELFFLYYLSKYCDILVWCLPELDCSQNTLCCNFQHERVRAIYKFALDRIPKESSKVLKLIYMFLTYH